MFLSLKLYHLFVFFMDWPIESTLTTNFTQFGQWNYIPLWQQRQTSVPSLLRTVLCHPSGFESQHLILKSSCIMTKYSGHFRNTQWDPFLLVSQIVAMQSVYYVSFGLWLSIIGLFTGYTRSLDLMFKYQVSSNFSVVIYVYLGWLG